MPGHDATGSERGEKELRRIKEENPQRSAGDWDKEFKGEMQRTTHHCTKGFPRDASHFLRDMQAQDRMQATVYRLQLGTSVDAGWLHRPEIPRSSYRAGHASANEKKEHINTGDWFGAVLQLADREFVYGLRGLVSATLVGPRFAAENVYFFPLQFNHLPDGYGCICCAEVDPS
ncbi:hypothetical protein N7519_004178 [Penicillium mononematosum]|uniref:uncharacterized protein n=1 Tax=Penicillium mononematosum TaxID=268346 RepID=UPI0025481EA7|nr:uncharacterized protein N7519_004178 [Penicillium mononematosum]KAJ6189270.1 hypothetical protein N7519_004178 [Penicillium mononematosum]